MFTRQNPERAKASRKHLTGNSQMDENVRTKRQDIKQHWLGHVSVTLCHIRMSDFDSGGIDGNKR